MLEKISAEHKAQFETIKKTLSETGSKEEHFLKVELLFFEAIHLAREYGDDPAENELLANLKNLQKNQYQETQARYKKSIQRERVIRRFINQLKGVLSDATKKNPFTPSARS